LRFSGSPGYNLSRFVQKLIQPLVSDSVLSSDAVMNNIKSINREILLERHFPVSLDVENMFHSIPRELASDCLHQNLITSGLDLCSLFPRDVVKLAEACLGCNHFKNNNQIYFQRSGLPMENRLSCILAELFMRKLVTERYSTLDSSPPTFRYVDDFLIFTKNIDEAFQLQSLFNANQYGLKFTLELPADRTLPFLDFKVTVDNGVAMFDFYRKPTRKDNFVNSSTSISKYTINNIIKNEWQRMKNRCSDSPSFKQHETNFIKRLRKNCHNYNARKFSTVTPQLNLSHNSHKSFYLNIPFVNDSVDFKIRKLVSEMGVHIRISHGSSRLRHTLSRKRNEETCTVANCKLNCSLCLVKETVYLIKCAQCGSSYVGSTWRHLHTR
jgi:hypothetical protein